MKARQRKVASAAEVSSLKEGPNTAFNRFVEKMPKERGQNSAYLNQMEIDAGKSSELREDAKCIESETSSLGREYKMAFTNVPPELGKTKIVEPEVAGYRMSIQGTREERDKQLDTEIGETDLVSPTRERESVLLKRPVHRDDNEALGHAIGIIPKALDLEDIVISSQSNGQCPQNLAISSTKDDVPIENQTKKTTDITEVQSMTSTKEASKLMSKKNIEDVLEKVDSNAADQEQQGNLVHVSSTREDAILASLSLLGDGIPNGSETSSQGSELRTSPKDVPPQFDKMEVFEYEVIDNDLPVLRREEKKEIQLDVKAVELEIFLYSKVCDGVPIERIADGDGYGLIKHPVAGLVNSSHLSDKQLGDLKIPSAKDGVGAKLDRTGEMETPKLTILEESSSGIKAKAEEEQSLSENELERAVSSELISMVNNI